MKRTFAAGLLALLTVGPEAHAQYPGCNGVIPPPGCGPVAGAIAQGSCRHLGCGGFCFKFLGAIHQHGPLWNYGPYTGYYPFEPYGPWNAALQYTGPMPGACCAGGLCGKCGLFGGLHGGKWGLGLHGRHFGRDACGGGHCWGGYAKTTFRNVFHRIFPLSHKSRGCGDCCADVGWTLPAAVPVAVVEDRQADVVQTGYPRSER
jgi:hypothetical protein